MATLYKRGNSYYLNWREDGCQFRRSLGTIDRRTAEAVRAEKAAELAGLILPRSGHTVRMILDDYAAWSQTARPASYVGTRASLRHVVAVVGDHSAEGFDVGHIERWAATSALAPATVAKSIKMARAAYRRAMRMRSVRENPFERVSLPKAVTSRAPPWYTREQLQTLYAAKHGHLWRFMANTGVRLAEIGKAVRSDVRGGKLYIESSPSGRTKSGRWRWVPLSETATSALAQLGEDRLVPVHKDTIGDWYRKEARGLGLPGTAHWLRHTFCTHLAQAGVSLHDIKALAGHSSVAVTEMYAHHLPGAGRAAIERLDL